MEEELALEHERIEEIIGEIWKLRRKKRKECKA
jgi:hypothetical protein